MPTFAAAAVITPTAVLRPGWVQVQGSHITAVAQGVPEGDYLDLGATVIAPGFVDLHCHGGGGSSFGDGPAAARRAIAQHRRHGTTSLMASLVAGSTASMSREVADLEPLVADGDLVGIHLEGPWLSPTYAGAHDPAYLRCTDQHEVRDLVASPAVRMVTIAPELPGALAAIEQMAAIGTIAAIGHTDADDATTRAAISAGARHATHLFNAMRPLRHRDAGPIPALLASPQVTLEVIVDGVHLDPAVVRWLVACTDSSRLVAVTDAMAAAGCADGAYRLGSLAVDVADGVATVHGTDTIAGSTASMDALFRTVAGPAPSDTDLLTAARVTATNPARVLGLAAGRIEPGWGADLVVLDEISLAVGTVVRHGATAPS